MKTRLLNGLDSEEITRLRENFVHSKPLRDRLIQVLNEEIESLYSSMRKEDLYDSPNWACIQADRIAQVKALKKMVSFLENE